MQTTTATKYKSRHFIAGITNCVCLQQENTGDKKIFSNADTVGQTLTQKQRTVNSIRHFRGGSVVYVPTTQAPLRPPLNKF